MSRWIGKGLRFICYGPSTNNEWIVFGLLLPITFPVVMIGVLITALLQIMVCESTGSVVIVGDGGSGDGFFDEVSCRRRDDYQFITGTGKYA